MSHMTIKPSNLFLLKKTMNRGDCDQIDGVARSTLEYFKHHDITLERVEVEIDQINHTQIKNNSIIIAAGMEGIHSLAKLEKLPENCLKVFLTHQWYPEIDSLIKPINSNKGADLIVIPSHVITEELMSKVKESSTDIVITIGVCHNLVIEDIINEYNLYKKEFPDSRKKLYIVLAGDALNNDKTWLYYTEQESSRLAGFIADYLPIEERPHTNLFVINGPRTGKFNSETKEENLTAHRNKKLDKVTQNFNDTLFKHGISRVYTYDFQYDEPSKFKAFLGSAEESEAPSEIFMPGESNSMIDQALDVLKKTSIIIYKHHAMNTDHKKNLEDVFATGRVQVLTMENKLLTNKAANQQNKEPYKPAREVVAEKIVQKFK